MGHVHGSLQDARVGTVAIRHLCGLLRHLLANRQSDLSLSDGSSIGGARKVRLLRDVKNISVEADKQCVEVRPNGTAASICLVTCCTRSSRCSGEAKLIATGPDAFARRGDSGRAC